MKRLSSVNGSGIGSASLVGWGLWSGLLGLVAALGLLAGPDPTHASGDARLVTIERAGPKAPETLALLTDPDAIAALERELAQVPPSTRGFPRWLVHVFQGSEREKSFVVFDEDLTRFPAIARAIGGEGGVEQRLYRLELPGRFWPESDQVVARLAQTGVVPLFYAGERSNWPYVEVTLTEQVESGPSSPAPAISPDEAEARARFMERVGALLRNKTSNRSLDAAYERLADQLYVHHRNLTSADDVSQFYTRYRRYRWRGNEGARVAVRAEYRTPSRDSAGAIDVYFRDRATRSAGQLEPKTFGIEILSDDASAGALRARLGEVFPEVVSVRAGRPLFE